MLTHISTSLLALSLALWFSAVSPCCCPEDVKHVLGVGVGGCCLHRCCALRPTHRSELDGTCAHTLVITSARWGSLLWWSHSQNTKIIFMCISSHFCKKNNTFLISTWALINIWAWYLDLSLQGLFHFNSLVDQIINVEEHWWCAHKQTDFF